MFSRKKKKYRTFVVTALIVAVCILIIVLLWPQNLETKEINEVNVSVDSRSNEPAKSSNEHENSQITDDVVKEENIEQETSTSTNMESYYIVKKNGEVISVFFVDKEGKKVRLEDTDIIYEVLTLEDQKLFETGIIVEDQEKLASLLQDFEG